MENFLFKYFSNRTEKLYQELKQRLFASSHPLAKRIVIVPSAAMKSWLMLQMAEDATIGIFAGIEICFVEPAMNSLFNFLSIKKSIQSLNQETADCVNLLSSTVVSRLNYYEPNELEIALALEKSMASICESYHQSAALPAEWQPLLQYLGIVKSEKKTSKLTFKRIKALASSLSKLFREYGLSAGSIVKNWGENPSDWQELLWREMELIFFPWGYSAKKLGSFQMDRSIHPQDVQIHVFGLSFLDPLHHRFLGEIAKQIPVYYYLLSPCQKFWADTLSEKESMRLRNYWSKQGINEGSLEALEDLLQDHNPLLANYGRLGREMAFQMESWDAQVKEHYTLPESISQLSFYSELDADEIIWENSTKPLTILGAIQADMVLLRSVNTEEKILFSTFDETVQVHAVPKKSREVQVVYDILLSLIDKHRHDPCPLLPGDIFIMAPNVSEYAPFIKSAFESAESQLNIQLMDMEVPTQYQTIQGFLHLLSLSSGRWEASSLLQLFDYAAFRERHRLSKEDILVIKKWVTEAGIYWGKDRSHRKELFDKKYQEKQIHEETSIGTWEFGLGRLLEGLAMLLQADSEESSYHPLDKIEPVQAELLGTVLHLIRSLQEDLKPLMNGTKLSLQNWSTYLECLFESYFLCKDDEKDFEGYKLLSCHMESFFKASKRLPDFTCTFETIYRHFKEGLEAEKSVYKEFNVQAVRFSSLLPMRAVPAKVVVLMGMDDGCFPGSDPENTLNLLFRHPKADYQPRQVDLDRYIFLESILSAREYFILSYTSQAPGDSKTLPPSILIKELLGYLDRSYSVQDGQYLRLPSTLCVYHHPLVPFDPSYYSSLSRLKSFSLENYLAALSYSNPDKKNPHPFISDFTPVPASPAPLENQVINLKDLLAFAKSPLKTYLNHALGIYLDRESDRIMKDEEDLFLTDLNASILTRKGLLGSKYAALKVAENTGAIPYGPFKTLGRARIEKEIENYQENLKTCSIAIDSLYSVELAEHCLKPQISLQDKEWHFPPIALTIECYGKVQLVGRVDHVCEKGLVLFCEDRLNKILELWPSCLILNYLIDKYQLDITPQMIFIKGNESKSKPFADPLRKSAEDSLKEYVEYFLNAKNSPSPVMPDWVPSIHSADKEALTNLLKDGDEAYRPKYDQYITWLERNSANADFISTSTQWQEKIKSLFTPVFPEGKVKLTGLGKKWLKSASTRGNDDAV